MAENQDAFLVGIGLFSGRPNPEMRLTDDRAAQLAELLQGSVGKERTNPPPAARLGEFYGFLVQLPPRRAKELGLPPRASVYSGVVTDLTEPKPVHWRDTSGVERFLTRSAYEQDFGELLGRLRVSEPE